MNKSDIKQEISEANEMLYEGASKAIKVGAAAAAIGGTVYVCYRLTVGDMKRIRETLKKLEERYATNDPNFIKFSDLVRGIISKSTGSVKTSAGGLAGRTQAVSDFNETIYSYSTPTRENVIVVSKGNKNNSSRSSYEMSIDIIDPTLRKYAEYYEAMIQLSFGSLSTETKRWVKAYMKDFKK